MVDLKECIRLSKQNNKVLIVERMAILIERQAEMEGLRNGGNHFSTIEQRIEYKQLAIALRELNSGLRRIDKLQASNSKIKQIRSLAKRVGKEEQKNKAMAQTLKLVLETGIRTGKSVSQQRGNVLSEEQERLNALKERFSNVVKKDAAQYDAAQAEKIDDIFGEKGENE